VCNRVQKSQFFVESPKSFSLLPVVLDMKDLAGDELGPTLYLIPGRAVDGVSELRARAERLRSRAESANEVLAITYRRRACELEFQAWLTELRAGHRVGPVAA
jgi:hypothetical protein